MINKSNLIKEAIFQILSAIGEDTSRPGLKETPLRVADSFNELFSGYGISAKDVVKDALFPCSSKSMVIEKDIEFYSLCEHHLLPFMGVVHIAYLPNNKIVGLSKVPRIVDIFSKRLQVQENLSLEILKALEAILDPYGVAVIIEAQHLCMMMRGVKKQKSITTTMEFSGLFEKDLSLRSNFLSAIK